MVGEASQAALPPSLSWERQGEIAVLRLDRPGKRNALDGATVSGLEVFFSSPPDGVKAMVICGAGDHFSAGLDLSDLAERSAPEGLAHSLAWHRAFDRIQFGRVPAGAVVVPGSLPAKDGSHSLYCAVIVKRVDAQTRAKTSLNELLRD